MLLVHITNVIERFRDGEHSLLFYADLKNAFFPRAINIANVKSRFYNA